MPWVWRRSRRLTSQAPTSPAASTATAATAMVSRSPRTSRSIEETRMPTDTSATTGPSRPSGPNTGTTARIDGPSVPAYSWVNTSPSSARPRSPMNGLPMLAGSGWV